MSFSEREQRVKRLFEDLSEPADAAPAFARYKVRGRLGEGATAVVYRAWDAELDREVALKVLRAAGALSELARERFRREARTAAGLVHPNLLTVHDAGEENGLLFLVMELVDGEPMGRTGRPLDERLGLLEQAARGVGAAHRKGIVHRDLKPGNILVTARGEAKVGDFGLAHLMDASAGLTKTGTTLGTPLYMAPEQVGGRGRDITPRTDVYALGAMLYEILTGRPPFEADSISELYSRIVNDEPVPPRRRDPSVPGELEKICLVALEKSPGRRYADADAFAEDLRRARACEPVLARPLPPALRAVRRSWRRPAVRAAAAALLALLAVWAAFAVRDASRVRAALAAAEAKERAGDAEEARLAFRLVLDLQAGHPGALAGLARLEGLAGDPAILPRLEQVRGDVALQGTGRRVLARDGMILAIDQTVRTLGDDASVRVTFPDSLRVDLRPRTAVRGLADRRPHLEGGALEAAGPLSITTDRASVEIVEGRAVVEADANDTRVEVAEGRSRLTRLADGIRAEVAAGQTASTRGGPEIAVRSSEAAEILLTPRQGIVTGGEWALVDEPDSPSGAALEVASRGASGDWEPLLNARKAGSVEFSFHARAGRPYSVWVRGRAPGSDIKHDAVFLEFADSEFVVRPKRIWAILDFEAAVFNGFYRNEKPAWIGGDADADGDVPPTTVRFRRTGMQTVRLYPFETPIRIDAIWLSTTQSDRPAPGHFPLR